MRGDEPLNWAVGDPRVGGACGPTWSSVGACFVRFSFLRTARMFEAIALAIAFEDVDMVGQLNQEGFDEPLGTDLWGGTTKNHAGK